MSDMVYSVTYRPDNDTHYLFDKEGRRILPQKPESVEETDNYTHYGFSFHDDYNDAMAVAWAELLDGIKMEPDVEYFRQAPTAGNMRDIISRVTSYWLDRGKAESPAFPKLVDWARSNLIDPARHDKDVSTLYTGSEAIVALEKVFGKYVELVKSRKFLNYGHYWSNYDRNRLLEFRVLHHRKFADIARQMGRTEAACRSEYGRIRRGEDNVTVELEDWDIMRMALPLGTFRKGQQHGKNEKRELAQGKDAAADEEDKAGGDTPCTLPQRNETCKTAGAGDTESQERQVADKNGCAVAGKQEQET